MILDVFSNLDVCQCYVCPLASVVAMTLTCCSARVADLCCETRITVGTAQCQWAVADSRLELPLVWLVLNWAWPCSLLKGLLSFSCLKESWLGHIAFLSGE